MIKALILPDLPPKGDVLDWLAAGGTAEQLGKLLATALPVDEALPKAVHAAADPGDRARIEVNADEHLVIEQAIHVLAADPVAFKRAGELVHIVREQIDADEGGIHRIAGTPRIRSMSAGYLRERLAARCFFWKPTKESEVQCPPPPFVVNGIHSRGFWEPLRWLSGITEIPVLRPDGSVLISPGWDESTGLLYEPTGDLPELPPSPGKHAAIEARDLLLDVVADFPFATDAHRSAWLAGLLTVLSRRAFTGPAPLFLMDANIRGSGKSLLADVVALITTGRAMPRLSNPKDDEEARKRITAIALAGDPLVLIDNIASTLGSASLDAALTSTSWKDRRLGASELVECPLRAVWFATGNNVVLLADTSRRVCHIRLESSEECPEERTDFQHPKLLAHVKEHRLQLLAAGLTILRSFVIAGKPDARLKPWGSFEGWSDLIRNCLVWIDLPDPGETRRELAETADRDATALRALFEGWVEVDPDGDGLAAAELVKLLTGNANRFEAVRGALCDLCGVAELTLKDARKVGNQLRRFRGRVMGSTRLEMVAGRARTNRWKVINSRCGVSGESGESFFSPSRARNQSSLESVYAGTEECETHTPNTPDSPLAVCEACGFSNDALSGPLCSACETGSIVFS